MLFIVCETFLRFHESKYLAFTLFIIKNLNQLGLLNLVRSVFCSLKNFVCELLLFWDLEICWRFFVSFFFGCAWLHYNFIPCFLIKLIFNFVFSAMTQTLTHTHSLTYSCNERMNSKIACTLKMDEAKPKNYISSREYPDLFGSKNENDNNNNNREREKKTQQKIVVYQIECVAVCFIDQNAGQIALFWHVH